MTSRSELTLTGIEGFFKRKVTKFGTSAKVDCPKNYLGREVYLVIINDGQGSKDSGIGAGSKTVKGRE